MGGRICIHKKIKKCTQVHLLYNQKKITMKRFVDWMMSDNVIYRKDSEGKYFFSTQDAQWGNRLYDIDELWNYFRKEF